MRRLFFCLLLTLLILAWLPGNASANMASPWFSGDPVGEPVGVFRQMEILNETLTLDLRPLQTDRMGHVVATYQVRNNGAQTAVELLFVSPGIKTGRVTVDNTPVPAKMVTNPAVPPEWKTPIQLPILGSQFRGWNGDPKVSLDDLYKTQNSKSGIRFQATLPPGEHQLKVSYSLIPSEYNSSDLYREYQIAYTLAPARSWAKFGQLNIEVNLPAGWEVATSLPMQRTGDTLQAAFPGIPADGLAITTRPSLSPIKQGGSMLLRATGWLVGLFISWRVGRSAKQWTRQRSSQGWIEVSFASAGLMLLGGFIFLLPALIGEFLGCGLLDNGHISTTKAYSHNFVVIFQLFLGFLLSCVVTLIAILYSRRSNKLIA